jgi:hypothetical protein
MITSQSQVSVEFALVVPYLDLVWGFVLVACSYYGVIMAYASIQQVQTLGFKHSILQSLYCTEEELMFDRSIFVRN